MSCRKGSAVGDGVTTTLHSAGPSRRSFLLGSAAALAALAGCATPGGFGRAPAGVYGALPDEPFPIPAVDISGVDPVFLRRVVRYNGAEPPGTIVVDLDSHHLYHVMADNRATRYGINGPREPFEWSGVAYVDRKTHWPIWTPTPDQIGRDPTLVEWAGGHPPGLENPLGSRALYLYQDGVYTLCTIYGTAHAWTLGQGVSSGCIGLLNQDIVHLYEQVPLHTRVVILPA